MCDMIHIDVSLVFATN